MKPNERRNNNKTNAFSEIFITMCHSVRAVHGLALNETVIVTHNIINQQLKCEWILKIHVLSVNTPVSYTQMIVFTSVKLTKC